MPTTIEKFLDELDRLWPGSTKTIRVLRAHNEYLEDQGHSDIILENLEASEKEENVGDGTIWDDGVTRAEGGYARNLETD